MTIFGKDNKNGTDAFPENLHNHLKNMFSLHV